MDDEIYSVALTTVDNPYDPFTQFDSWFNYDNQKGYHSCAYLDRISNISDEMSDEEREKAVENAIDEIIKYDFMNIYKKVRISKSKLEEFEEKQASQLQKPIVGLQKLTNSNENSDDFSESAANLQNSETKIEEADEEKEKSADEN
jgi:hypothetical protein